MITRSIWQWLLVGALLSSAYANIGLYRRLKTPTSAQAPSAVDPGAIPSFHLAPGSSSERCPTLDLLGLTQEQRNQIQECSLTSLDLRTDLAIEINAASTELDDLLSMDAIDGPRILELADLITSLRSQQYKAWIASILVVRDVLTPEQLQLLHKLESK